MELIETATYRSLPVPVTLKNHIPKAHRGVNHRFAWYNTKLPVSRFPGDKLRTKLTTLSQRTGRYRQASIGQSGLII